MSSKEYKAMANYLVNQLEFTKDYVFKYLDQRLDGFLKDFIEQRSYRNAIDTNIRNEVASLIKNGVVNDWYQRDSFEKLIRQVIKEEVQKRIDGLLEVKVNFKTKLETEK